MAGGWLIAGVPLLGAVVFAVLLDGRSGLLIVTVTLGAAWLVKRLAPPSAEPPPPMAKVEPQPATETYLRDALECAPLATLLIDRDATICFVNAQALRLFPALRIGDPLSLRLRVPEVLDAIAATLREQIAQSVEFTERRPVERAFLALTAPLPSYSAQDPAVAVFLQDASGPRRIEAMRSNFVANASHELRTPLASILGFIETLQGPARDDTAARKKFLAIMAEQARRMARLVDDLLSLSRIELKEHIAPTGQVDVRGVVGQIADALSGLAAERGVALAVKGGPPVLVTGDRDDLLRVFDNLMENAIKYGRAGGRVDVEILSETATDVVVQVRDYGAGIDPQHLPRLTERFYRVDTTHSRAEGGTGLGLALVKHIVNRHRGRLDIESQPGEGATFSVTLPRAPQDRSLS